MKESPLVLGQQITHPAPVSPLVVGRPGHLLELNSNSTWLRNLLSFQLCDVMTMSSQIGVPLQ